MDLSKLTVFQRLQRTAIRNYFLLSSVEQLRKEQRYRRGRKDQVGVDALQEMIDECEAHGVANYGELPV